VEKEKALGNLCGGSLKDRGTEGKGEGVWDEIGQGGKMGPSFKGPIG